jgi:hypothetical protein
MSSQPTPERLAAIKNGIWRVQQTMDAEDGVAAKRARGSLLRRVTDPWESHESGVMNTLVPEPEIPSHQGPDLDVVTMAVKVPRSASRRR